LLGVGGWGGGGGWLGWGLGLEEGFGGVVVVLERGAVCGFVGGGGGVLGAGERGWSGAWGKLG